MAHKNIKLSILICSVENEFREKSLKKLVGELDKQILETNSQSIVEILIEKDKGEMAVGKKRNVLLQKAKGEYVCFIDDDDFIANNYLNTILKNLTKDIFLIRIDHIHNGNKSKAIQPSLYIDYIETTMFTMRNNFLHLCPHKKEIALKVMFEEINFAEDMLYSKKIIPFIQSYNTTDELLYIYDFNTANTLTRNV